MLSQSSIKTRVVKSRFRQQKIARKTFQISNVVSTSIEQSSNAKQYCKERLRSSVTGTQRGARRDVDISGEIEEALVEVEKFGGPLDDKLLAGRWKLIYTTAPDVVGVLLPGAYLPWELVKIEDIYQEFSDAETGKVDNIIRFSIPGILREGDGGTFRVNAEYRVRSRNRIQLQFKKAQLGELNPTESFEFVLAPSLLPRKQVNQMLLLGVKEFKFEQSLQISRVGFQQPLGDYMLTFMDEDMLIGRALNGTFIFDKVSL